MMSRRSALVLAPLLFALAPLAGAHAARPHGGGGGAVLLRYRFVPGQTLAYQLTADVQAHTTTAGLPAGGSGLAPMGGVASSTQVSGVLQQHVEGVDASGGATVTVTLSSLVVTATIGGQTTTTPLTATAVPTTTVYIAPDGSQHGRGAVAMNGLNGLNGVNTQSVGALPPGPVLPGARWTTTSSTTLPLPANGRSSLQFMVQNILRGYEQLGGEPVAIIDSTEPINVATNLAVGGQSAHLRETGTATAQTFFGLSTGQLVASQSQENLLIGFSARVQGRAVSLQVRTIIQSSLRRVGA